MRQCRYVCFNKFTEQKQYILRSLFETSKVKKYSEFGICNEPQEAHGVKGHILMMEILISMDNFELHIL